MRTLSVVATLLAVLLLAAPALAGDWIVVKLRGGVQLLADDVWTDLKRGDVVPNEHTVRTLADGHADLQRDREILKLGVNTQIAISDETERVYTSVTQEFGTLEVDAEARNVEHFAVNTPYLAAVVKGTHFIVTSDDRGASVAVDRGRVSVQSVASKRNTTITVGQTATVSRKAGPDRTDFTVSGVGPWPTIADPESSPIKAGALVSGEGAGGGSPVTRIASADSFSLRGSTHPSGSSLPPASLSTAMTGGSGTVPGGGVASLATPRAGKVEEVASTGGLGVLMGAAIGALFGGLGLVIRKIFR